MNGNPNDYQELGWSDRPIIERIDPQRFVDQVRSNGLLPTNPTNTPRYHVEMLHEAIRAAKNAYWYHREQSQGWLQRMQKLLQESKLITVRGTLSLTEIPEAMGVNVTATMTTIGVELEWPPKQIVRKIILLGVKK